MNAPRILRDIKGDFDLSVRVAGTSHPGGKATTTVYSPYHGAGLLIWQDEENYVRLEIAADLQHGKARPYVNFEYRKEGALAVSSGIMNTDGSNHLRLKRRGDEIYASFGPDGAALDLISASDGQTQRPPDGRCHGDQQLHEALDC